MIIIKYIGGVLIIFLWLVLVKVFLKSAFKDIEKYAERNKNKKRSIFYKCLIGASILESIIIPSLILIAPVFLIKYI